MTRSRRYDNAPRLSEKGVSKVECGFDWNWRLVDLRVSHYSNEAAENMLRETKRFLAVDEIVQPIPARLMLR